MSERSDKNSVTSSEGSFEKHVEGGRQAWLTVFGSFLIYYSSFGMLNSFGFFQAFYQEDYLANVASPSTISFIGTIQLALMNGLSTISGAICDAHGIRYLYMFSGAGTTSALILLSFCPKDALWQIFLVQSLFMGISVGFGLQPAMTTVARHFQTNRALALGMVTSGGALGAVCYSMLFMRLQPVIGFDWTMRVASFKVLACYSIALCISEDRLICKKLKLRTLFDYRGFLNTQYALLALGACFVNLGLWAPGYHIKSYACLLFSKSCDSIGKYLLPIMSASSVPGMVTGGILGDRIGRLNILIPSAFISGVICVTLWFSAPTVSVLAIFAAFFGFTSGTVVSILSSVISQIVPTQKIGARIGAFYSVVSIATLVGAPIGGVLLGDSPKSKEQYHGLIAFSGVAMLVGSLVFLLVRFMHDRNWRTRW